MEMLTNILLLVVGFVLLIKGADFFVDGSSSIAKLLKVPSIIIGLTIVAIGTSAPELAVSVTSAMKGSNALAISNVIGSNLFNLLMVIGISAMMSPVPVDKGLMKKEFPFSLVVSVLLAGMLFVTNVTTGEFGLTRLFGAILLALFVAFIVYMVMSALKSRNESGEEEETKTRSPLVSIIFIVGGIAAIVFGGDLVVDCASKIALSLGMTQTLVGLTIVAVGTSLPELVTSLVAVKKGENDMALGNVVGSNICNILLILGTSSLISPITLLGVAGTEAMIDLIIVVVVSVLAFIFARRSYSVSKPEGGVMVFIYVAYVAYAILRVYM